MTSRVRFAVVSAVLSLAVAGCGGSDGSSGDEPSAAPVSAKPAIGDAVTGTGYSYIAPKNWHKPPKPIPGFDPDSIVFNTKDRDGFADNINVLRAEAPTNDLDALQKIELASLESAHATDVKVIDRKLVAKETAVHLTSTASQNGRKYHVDQFLILRGRFEYAITFSASATVTRADQDALAESVLATWKWTA